MSTGSVHQGEMNYTVRRLHVKFFSEVPQVPGSRTLWSISGMGLDEQMCYSRVGQLVGGAQLNHDRRSTLEKGPRIKMTKNIKGEKREKWCCKKPKAM